MTTQVHEFDNPKFHYVNLVKDRHTSPRLDLTVEGLGNIHSFSLIRPDIIMPQGTSIEDIKRLLEQEWTVATIRIKDNQGNITYTLECEDNVGESSMLSIHAQGYQENDVPKGLKTPSGKK